LDRPEWPGAVPEHEFEVVECERSQSGIEAAGAVLCDSKGWTYRAPIINVASLCSRQPSRMLTSPNRPINVLGSTLRPNKIDTSGRRGWRAIPVHAGLDRRVLVECASRTLLKFDQPCNGGASS
jgi:hypothetical protein